MQGRNAAVDRLDNRPGFHGIGQGILLPRHETRWDGGEISSGLCRTEESLRPRQGEVVREMLEDRIF